MAIRVLASDVPSRSGGRSLLALAMFAGAIGCGGPRGGPVAAAPAALRSGPEDGPPPPTRGLSLPSLAAPWTPPMLVAGDLDGLAAALARHEGVTLTLGPRLAGATWARRGAELVSAVSPNTKIVATTAAGLATIAGPEAELAAPRRAGGGGRPRYTAALRAQVGGPTLAIDDVTIDLPRWQALPSSSVGSCEPAMRALADGQELALGQLAPFLDHADALLARRYRERLAPAIQRLARGLVGGGEGPAAACRQGYAEVVRAHAACLTDAACEAAPRVVLVGGARIVAAEPRVTIAEGCPGLVGRDVALELRAVAEDAARGVTLDRGWSTLADRLGTMTEIHAALDDACAARRRRFTAEDVAEARARLARIGVALGSDDLGAGGRWVADSETLAVPGLGTVRALARFDAGPGSVHGGVVAEARALREFVLARALCRAGHAAAPIAAVVADPTGGVQFFGYFYEEELFCGSLPPLRG